MTAVMLAGVAAIAVVWTRQGHKDELLIVTLRIVDRESDRPMNNALVATVRYRDALGRDYFERDFEAAAGKVGVEDAWTTSHIAAARSTGDGSTNVLSSAYVTRCWVGPVQVSEDVVIPEVLLIEHLRLGRVVVSIDPQIAVSEGSEPHTWRLDLGTIRVPPVK